MGTIYSVACKKCKVTRDLDKFYTARPVDNRCDALSFSKEIIEDSFRVALLVSFLAEHKGHECVFFDEHSSCDEELNPFYNDNEYKYDRDYWINSTENKETNE